MTQAITPQQLHHKEPERLTPFVRHLLQMDDRIRLCGFYGDVEEDKGFFITKEAIHIPYILPLVEHDIAHLCELVNPNRWTMDDWGMSRFDEPKIKPRALFAAFTREVRTRAIQMHMMRFKDEQEKLRSTAYSQLNNFYWVDCIKQELPFGRFKSMQDVQDFNASLRERVYQKWNTDRIETEWVKRLTHIQNYMETQHG